MSRANDNENLLARARGGDRAAVDTLIREFSGMVYGAALRQTRDAQVAADVSQAVFVVFVRRVATIRAARALPAWFLQTTRYAAAEARRAASRRARHEHRAARVEHVMDATPVDADPKLAMLDDAIASLRKADREVVLMRYLQGRDVREIAADLGLGEEAARKRISRAVERMRAFFAGRGVVTSADAVAALLAAAGTTSMPTAVLEACTSAVAGGAVAANAGVVAKGVLYGIGAAKLKVAATAAAVFVTVAGIAVASATLGPRARRVVVTPDPAVPASMTKAQAFAELGRAYALADGEVIRMIQPPFPAARAAWVDAEFPYAGGSHNVVSLGFRATASGLEWRYMSYVPLDLDKLVTDVPWFRIEGLDRVSFPPLTADLVVRDGLTNRQRLEAVAGLVAASTGVRYRVVEGKTTRPCVILKGPTRRPPNGGQGSPTVILTQSPLNPAATKRWLGGDYPEGTRPAGALEAASRLVDAPFFLERPDARDGAYLNDVHLFLVAPDAQLDWTDPLFEARLQKILNNLPRQIGGEWRIERRTLDVLRLERAGG